MFYIHTTMNNEFWREVPLLIELTFDFTFNFELKLNNEIRDAAATFRLLSITQINTKLWGDDTKNKPRNRNKSGGKKGNEFLKDIARKLLLPLIFIVDVVLFHYNKYLMRNCALEVKKVHVHVHVNVIL